jgi:hypothetical protein
MLGGTGKSLIVAGNKKDGWMDGKIKFALFYSKFTLFNIFILHLIQGRSSFMKWPMG